MAGSGCAPASPPSALVAHLESALEHGQRPLVLGSGAGCFRGQRSDGQRRQQHGSHDEDDVRPAIGAMAILDLGQVVHRSPPWSRGTRNPNVAPLHRSVTINNCERMYCSAAQQLRIFAYLSSITRRDVPRQHTCTTRQIDNLQSTRSAVITTYAERSEREPGPPLRRVLIGEGMGLARWRFTRRTP